MELSVFETVVSVVVSVSVELVSSVVKVDGDSLEMDELVSLLSSSTRLSNIAL